MFEAVNALIDKKEVPGNLEKACELLESLEREHPSNDIVRGKLSHAFYYRGRFAPEGSREREDLFDRGVEYGKAAIALNKRAIYGNYWYGSNIGALGVARGIMASLRSIDPMRKAMTVVLGENERFFFAGPHRVLGRLFHQAPGWPISVGNKGKALDHLERAVELAPTYFLNRLYLAEFYVDTGNKRKARPHVDYLVQTTLNPDHAIEDGEYQQQARQLADKLL